VRRALCASGASAGGARRPCAKLAGVGGRRVEIRRPRARSTAGQELRLPSWQAWSSHDPLDERAFEQTVLGVSTRRYARSLEPLPQEVEVHGISKSVISERFVVGTGKLG